MFALSSLKPICAADLAARSGLTDGRANKCSFSYTYSLVSGQNFESFLHVSSGEVHKIIKASKSKTCTLDPLPTWLLKICIEDVLPALTEIVNKSLEGSVVTENMKQAIITPLLKKPGLDPILKNYRPVSNLSFLSKVVERIVAKQLLNHIYENKCHEILQSAYKTNHSTETALLRVKNDIVIAMDGQKVVLLILLDLSAAFDTVDHEILLNCMSSRFGIKGKVLEWFRSYLSNRGQAVMVNGALGNSQTLKYGVPQGSVLGPILFTLYTAPLADVVRQHNVQFHFYADDTQLCLSFKPNYDA